MLMTWLEDLLESLYQLLPVPRWWVSGSMLLFATFVIFLMHLQRLTAAGCVEDLLLRMGQLRATSEWVMGGCGLALLKAVSVERLQQPWLIAWISFKK